MAEQHGLVSNHKRSVDIWEWAMTEVVGWVHRRDAWRCKAAKKCTRCVRKCNLNLEWLRQYGQRGKVRFSG